MLTVRPALRSRTFATAAAEAALSPRLAGAYTPQVHGFLRKDSCTITVTVRARSGSLSPKTSGPEVASECAR